MPRVLAQILPYLAFGLIATFGAIGLPRFRKLPSASPASQGDLTRSPAQAATLLGITVVIAALALRTVLTDPEPRHAIPAVVVGGGFLALGVWHWLGRTKVRVSWDDVGIAGPPLDLSGQRYRLAWGQIARIGPDQSFPKFASDGTGGVIKWGDCGRQEFLVAELRRRRPDLFAS